MKGQGGFRDEKKTLRKCPRWAPFDVPRHRSSIHGIQIDETETYNLVEQLTTKYWNTCANLVLTIRHLAALDVTCFDANALGYS